MEKEGKALNEASGFEKGLEAGFGLLEEVLGVIEGFLAQIGFFVKKFNFFEKFMVIL